MIESTVQPSAVHPRVWSEGRETVVGALRAGQFSPELLPLSHVIIVSALHLHSFVVSLSVVTHKHNDVIYERKRSVGVGVNVVWTNLSSRGMSEEGNTPQQYILCTPPRYHYLLLYQIARCHSDMKEH